VLAGGGADAVSALQASAPNKAFVRIAGRALVGRTIEGLRGTPRIGRIVVVAPSGSHDDPALAGADERRDDGARMTDSLRSGLRGAPADELLAIVASDLPILSAAAVDDFLDRAESSGADVVYACVERRTHASRFLEVPHTWARLRDGTFCGGGLTALRPRALPALERFLERLGAARKNPVRLASIFGWDVLARYALGRLSIADAEARATRLLGARVAAAVCAYPEIAVNVDRPSDVALAERLVAARLR
jgi:hypothetical protein